MLRRHPGPALLAASIPLSMPWEALNAAVIVIGALVGGWLLWRARGQTVGPGLRSLGWISLALLLPALLSALDATDRQLSWTWALAALRFPLFAAALIVLAGDLPRQRAMLFAIAGVIALWLVDALAQAAFGVGLAGRAEADRLSGIFGSDDLKLGPSMAVLAPLLLAPLLSTRGWLIGSYIALLLIVLLAGARAGWIGFLVATLALAWQRWGGRPKRLLLALLLGAVLGSALVGAGYVGSERFAERVDRTTAMFDGDREALDYALAGRLPIFATALRMAADHPINGVGVRGFRYAYPNYAASDDPWVTDNGRSGAAHPHHLLLEVLAEQGLIGLLGLLLAIGILLQRWRRSDPHSRQQALGPAIALLVLLFPFNTHPALYSSFWSALWWWLLGLYLAMLEPPRRPQ